MFGAESSSLALVFYDLQFVVEVVSAILVTWRFLGITQPGDESVSTSTSLPQVVRIWRIATNTIGVSLLALSFLAARDHPTTLHALTIAASATAVMVALYLAKRSLAHPLHSSTSHGKALRSLQCTQPSLVLLVASLVYRVWNGGWWMDSATAIAIAVLFGWEGIKMIRWAQNQDFDGGCCAGCWRSDQSMGACHPLMKVAKSEELEQKQGACSTQCCGCRTP